MSGEVLSPDFIKLPSGDLIPVAPGFDQDYDDFIGAIASVIGIGASIYGDHKKKEAAKAANREAERAHKEALAEQKKKEEAAKKAAREQAIQMKAYSKNEFFADRSKKETIIYISAGVGVFFIMIILYFALFKKKK